MDDIEARRRELQRRAFGRPQSPEDAHEALLELQSLNASSVEPAPDPAVPDDSAAQPLDGQSSSPIRRRSIRPILLVAVIVIAVVCGVVAGRLSSGLNILSAGAHHPSATAMPGSSSFAVDPNFVYSGGQGLDQWFSGTQTASDSTIVSPPSSSPDAFDQKSTRLVEISAVDGDVWIARRTNPNDGVCIINQTVATEAGTATGAINCTSLADFARSGISLKNGPVSVHWTMQGVEVTTTN